MIGRNIGQKILFIAAVGMSIFFLFLVIACNWIGYDIKIHCQDAQRQYNGDCIVALSSMLDDDIQDFRSRNTAIWALGQLGDQRALPVLEKYYTGIIPAREPYDDSISQYELSKAIKLLNGGLNLFSWTWRWNVDIGETDLSQTGKETVILCENGDPYYSLAEKISKNENIDIIHSLQEIQAYNPKYILMVAAPTNITEEKIVNIGKYFKKTDSYPALGVVTGSTIEIAENLYRKGNQVVQGNNYIGSDTDTKTNIDRPLIFREGTEPRQEIDLTEQSLIDTLQTSDYFYWARHVSSTRWIWNSEEEHVLRDEDCLTADEVPDLKPVIIHTPSCGSFQPWKDNSIALSFIDHGAAAYIGHLQSPFNSGVFIGHTQYLPGKYTWKDFPIGMMMQVQNHNTARVVFETPLFFMMGDPRMYLSDELPYQIISDETYQNSRIIQATTDYKGVIPVKIENGASYSFINIEGISKTADEDLFNNIAIESLNFQNDKYILFVHPGGDFQIELKKNPPLLWMMTDTLLDALDYSWIVIGVVLSPISIAFLFIFLLVLYFSIIRKKRDIKNYLPIFIFALFLAVAHSLYILTRSDAYTVTGYVVNYSITDYILGIIGTFSTISGGLILMKNARRKRSIISGMLLAILPQLILTLFYLVYMTFINIMFLMKNTISMTLWNYNSVLMLTLVLVIDILVVFLFQHLSRKKQKEQNLQVSA